MSEKKHELIIAALGLLLAGILIICAAFDLPGFSQKKSSDKDIIVITTEIQKSVTEKHYEQETEYDNNPTGIININTASAEELTSLSGIGSERANAIVEYRNEYGNFDSVEELTNIYGIGESTLDEIRDYITAE